MASVFQTILDALSDERTFFVFPSETTVVLWARKICLHGAVRSLARERFLAWDRFKEEAIRAVDHDRRPVSSLIRRLFARSLTRKNAAHPFLQALIPSAFAANSSVFADSIASMLPSLGLWEEKMTSLGKGLDDEDRDMGIIKTMYKAFLDERRLFEPSWERVSFRDNGKRYIVFFPEMLADFSEYEALFEVAGGRTGGAEPALQVYGVDAWIEENTRYGQGMDKKSQFLFFASARQEIRAAALEIRRLYEEEGIAYEDMAVTLPDFTGMEPYVSREFVLHDIPVNLRAGKNLGDYPAGRLFSLVNMSVSSFFSFDTLKSLLLDTAIPWKDQKKNRELITYGIDNHCVASFRVQGRMADPWEEAFKLSPHEELSAYYGELKRRLSALAASQTFSEVRERYYGFRTLLDMEQCSEENNAVLARCIEELAVLIETENAFPDLMEAPFDFFVSHLGSKNYVYVREAGGVNIYDYPVAAGAPFACHIVLNASQAAAALERRPLAFLRQEKRSRLGLEDKDVSVAALSLYGIAPWNDYRCRSRFSASEKTFSGWAIPHSMFSSGYTADEPAKTDASSDLFAVERQWRAGGAEKPSRLFSVQRRGFENWSRVLLGGSAEGTSGDTAADCGKSLEAGELSEKTAALLRERILNKNTEDVDSGAVHGGAASAVPSQLSLSATDMNEFFECPVLWLYKRIFRLEPHLEDAALLNDEARGLLYHRILHLLFDRIKKRDKVFRSSNLERYFEWVDEISSTVLHSDNTLKGPLKYPLILPLAAAMNRRLRILLKTEARYFSGCEVAGVEQRYDLVYDVPEETAAEEPQIPLRLSGRIDRVSLAPQGPVIIDYKINPLPVMKECRKDDDDDGIGLRNFQIPMYIKLYETAANNKVNTACFVSIHKHKYLAIVGELPGGRTPCSREMYNRTMDALEDGIAYMREALVHLDFAPDSIPGGGGVSPGTCAACCYKTICRSLYSLNPSGDVYSRTIVPATNGNNENGETNASC